MLKSIYDILNKEIIEQSNHLIFPHNSPIIRSNEQLDYLYYIVQGRAKIYQYTESGKEIFIHFISKNDWIGELTFLGIEEETKNVISIGETTVIAIPKEIVVKQLLLDSTFLLEMNRFVARKLLDRTQNFVKNQSYDLKYRLATLMIDMSHDDIYSEKHTNIVDYLGVSYCHLLQTIHNFQKQGHIKKAGRSSYRIDSKKLMTYYIH
ncbi:cyclic nucleotide-binding protein [Streptococcus agalactiae]|nr:cyclic nucleotide-binding protein [Streptococcus agalactiae]